jgi:hypothetical protein
LKFSDTHEDKRILFAGCLVLVACLARGNDQTTSSAAPAGTRATDLASGFSGKVVETMNAANYTYVCVDTGKQKRWAAAPQFTVKVGDTVAIASGMAMPNYHSKVLDRDFDVVYFTGSVAVNGTPPSAEGQTAILPKDPHQ